MRLRRFTAAGLARFRALLAEGSENGPAEVPEDLVSGPLFTEEVEGGVEVQASALDGTRLQAAGYLDGRLAASGISEPEQDPALWAWLSAFYFGSVCPKDRRGRRNPGSLARYLPQLADSRRTYRHRLLGPWLVFNAHRDDPYRALCLLAQPITRPGELVERFGSRPRLVACPAAIGAATLLFCDSSGTIRRSAASAADRFADVLMQLDRTYDLYGMTADSLLGLLPREFEPFLLRGAGRS